jgi:hypothetical protein
MPTSLFLICQTTQMESTCAHRMVENLFGFTPVAKAIWSKPGDPRQDGVKDGCDPGRRFSS